MTVAPAARLSVTGCALQELADWLVGTALPLWASRRQSPTLPFAEALGLDGAVHDTGFLRMRVHARQSAVFAQAMRLGLPVDPALVREAWDVMRTRFWRGGQGWAARLDSEARAIDDGFTLYDQAFAMYACAHLAAALRDDGPLDLAGRTLALIEARLRVPGIAGWTSAAGIAGPREQNPHMHFLEALLALHAVAPAERWAGPAREILDLAASRLIDPAHGCIAEQFAPDWTPLAPVRIEPGHQFEWATLLAAAEAAGLDCAIDRRALADFGLRHGFAPSGLIVAATTRAGRLLDGSHRLWAQCEAIRALACTGRPHESAAAATLAAAVRSCHLATPVAGTWHDRLGSGLQPLDNAIPASTLYHLWEAVAKPASAGLVRLA